MVGMTQSMQVLVRLSRDSRSSNIARRKSTGHPTIKSFNHETKPLLFSRQLDRFKFIVQDSSMDQWVSCDSRYIEDNWRLTMLIMQINVGQ